MGHKNQSAPAYNAALAAAQQPSAAEQQRQAWDTGIVNAFNSKDYRDPSAFGIVPNFFDSAVRARQRSLQMGAHPQGAAALGGGDPTALALDQQNMADHDAEDAAASYQDQVQGAVRGALADDASLTNTDLQRKLGVLDQTAGVYRQELQRPSWFQSLLGAFGQVGQGLAGNPAFIAKFGWGGVLKKPGDVAVVGDDPQGGPSKPELAVMRPDRTTQIIPLVDPSEDSDGPQNASAAAQGGVATRPRRVSQPIDDYARARRAAATDPNAPIADSPNLNQPAPPMPQPLAVAPSSVTLDEPVPMTGKVRNAPRPGEEDLNDARFKVRAAEADIPAAPADNAESAATRPRWSDPIDQQEEQNAALHDLAAHPTKESRLKAIAKMSLLGFLRGGPGGAIAGATVGAVDPSLPNAMKYGAQAAQSDARLGQLNEQHQQDLADERTEAQIDLLKAHPGIEQAKADAAARKQEQSRIFRVLGSMKGQYLDPNNPRIAKLLSDADAAGIPVDVDSFNNSKGNTVRYATTDPDHPERTRLVERNVVTGEEADLGQKGFQASRNAEGMTGAEVHADADRDRAFEATERQRAIQNEFRRQQINLSAGHLKLAQAAQDNRLSEQSRRELKGANDLAAEAERYQQAANDIGSRTSYVDPQDGQTKESRKAANQRDLYAGRAASLRQKLIADYGYIFDADGTGPRMTADKFKGLFPSLQGNWSGEAQRLGVTLTDSPTQGPVRQSPMPRRGAPRQSSPQSQPGGRFAGQRMSRANLPAAAQTLGVSTDEAERIITREGGTIY